MRQQWPTRTFGRWFGPRISDSEPSLLEWQSAPTPESGTSRGGEQCLEYSLAGAAGQGIRPQHCGPAASGRLLSTTFQRRVGLSAPIKGSAHLTRVHAALSPRQARSLPDRLHDSDARPAPSLGPGSACSLPRLPEYVLHRSFDGVARRLKPLREFCSLRAARFFSPQ